MPIKRKSKIQEIIEKSGNSFHSDVVKSLRNDSNWKVIVSPYYSDNFTDKPREIDIIAEKEKYYAHGANDEILGTVNPRLFIECKYINEETLFWFDSKDKERAVELTMASTGLDHPYNNITINSHHYLSDNLVAKLIDSGKGVEKNSISLAINQSLNAFVYYKNKPSLILPEENGWRSVIKIIPYPIIVVNTFDNFYRIDMSDDSKEISPIKPPFNWKLTTLI